MAQPFSLLMAASPLMRLLEEDTPLIGKFLLNGNDTRYVIACWHRRICDILAALARLGRVVDGAAGSVLT